MDKRTELKQIAEAGIKFNSSLQNLYQNGNESIGWPSDDEKSLGRNNTISSLSSGGE